MSQLPDSTSDLSRRSLLRGTAAAGLLATPAVALLSACAGSSTGDDTADTGAKTNDNPLGVADTGMVDVVVFLGGLGDAYA